MYRLEVTHYLTITVRLRTYQSTARSKRDGTRAETRFGLSAKRTSPYKSAEVSVKSTAGSRGVRISGQQLYRQCSDVQCKTTGYPLHSHLSLSLPLPCVTVCHQVLNALYNEGWLWSPNWTLNSYVLQHRVSPGYMQHTPILPLPECMTFTKVLFYACLFTPLTNLPPLYFTPSHIFGLTLCGLCISTEVFLCAFEKLWKATISFGMHVCLFVSLSIRPSVRPPARKNLAPTGRIFMKFDTSDFFKNLKQKIQV